jgi:hypothetical protein
MDVVWTPSGVYRRASYAGEADLEASILHVQTALFGANRIYLDVKKRIGGENGPHNIPDGYLVDLTGQRPYLYVVENELAAHDPLRHIAVQILQFSLSFEEAPRAVKTILFNALQAQTDAKQQCEHYAAAHGFRNLDHMLDWLVFEGTFAALVIIDEMPENLENVLLTRFKFGVEVLELARYENDRHERFYHFEPFLADVSADVAAVVAGEGTTPRPALSPEEADTVVVPAHEAGARETFLGEHRWHAVRIHGAMRPRIKYIALYQVAPVSAITHVAPVRSIEPWKESDRVVVNFAEPAEPISPIRWVRGGHVKTFQNLRYTTYARLTAAKTLDDIW